MEVVELILCLCEHLCGFIVLCLPVGDGRGRGVTKVNAGLAGSVGWLIGQELLDMIVVERSHRVHHPQWVGSGKNSRHRGSEGEVKRRTKMARRAERASERARGSCLSTALITIQTIQTPSGFAHFLFSTFPVFVHRISCHDTASIVPPAPVVVSCLCSHQSHEPASLVAKITPRSLRAVVM